MAFKKDIYFVLILLLCVLPEKLFSQDTTKVVKNKTEKKPKKIGPLFETTDTISFSIASDIKALLKDRGEKPIFHNAVVTINTKETADFTVPVKLQARGHFRKSTANCSFPPLWLDFEGKEKGKTIFKHQDKLKLVTHCVKKDLVIREFAVYKLYELVSDLHYKTKLSKVTYIDSLKSRATETRNAFLIESDEDFGIRNNLTEVENVNISQSSIDTMNMATVAVFEYLIGNTDWSVPAQHNIKIFVKNKKYAMAVPYDFDHSGLVGAPYAKPPEVLGLASVEERMYRGISYPDATYLKVFEKFKSIKEEIYAIYNKAEFEDSYKKFVIEYLDQFYKKLENPKGLIAEISKTAMKSLKR
jgi:hypothetical protein